MFHHFHVSGRILGSNKFTGFVIPQCRMFVGDMLLVRANRPIPAGVEIVWSYVESTDALSQRQAALNKHGFKCSCALCLDQASMEQKAKDQARVSS